MATDGTLDVILVDATNDSSIPRNGTEFRRFMNKRFNPNRSYELIDSIHCTSRHHWLICVIQDSCSMFGVTGLEFLYGIDKERYRWHRKADHAFWFRGILVSSPEMIVAVEAIDKLLAEFANNINRIAKDLDLAYFANEEDIKEALGNPVLTCSPSSWDAGVRYADDGDGPWCLFSFLVSLKRLIEIGLDNNKSLLYVEWAPC